MALTEQQRRVVAWLEERWMGYSEIPSPERLSQTFNLTPKQASQLLTSEEVRKALDGRGIPTSAATGLTSEQVTTINTIMNPMDTRSRRKKLQDLGVDPRIWDGWMKNPIVRQYMKARADQLLSDAIPEAHMALVDNVLRGEFTSIKFLYEMTGHYTGQQQPMDIGALTQKIIEIIQIHVQDPQTLLNISKDLLGLAEPATVKPNDVIEGELIPQPPVAPPFKLEL